MEDNPTHTPRLILIDDDAIYGRILQQLAHQRGIKLDHFQSLAELGYVALIGKYDVVILDYDLGGMTGIEIESYLNAFFRGLPMLLISGSLRKASRKEVESGRAHPFMHKKSGYEAILSTALSLDAGHPSSTERQHRDKLTMAYIAK
jgi:DNA-binding response OmpR family regulator